MEQREADDADVEPEVDQVDDATEVDLSFCWKTPVWLVVFRQAHDGKDNCCQKTNSDIKRPPMQLLVVGIDLDEGGKHQWHTDCVSVLLTVKVLPVEERLFCARNQRSSCWKITEALRQQH